MLSSIFTLHDYFFYFINKMCLTSGRVCDNLLEHVNHATGGPLGYGL